MIRIAYMGIICEQPEVLRDFYASWFGFDEIHRTEWGTIHVTDGTTNIGLMMRGKALAEEDQSLGLHHIGFEVDNTTEIIERLKAYDPSIRIERRPEEDPFAEWRTWDPEGLPIDISQKGYGVGKDKRVPGIRHMAVTNTDPIKKLEFYHQVFWMRNATRTMDDRAEQGSDIMTTRAVFAGDSFINLALLPSPGTAPNRPPTGFNHFGVLIRSPQDVMEQIASGDPSKVDLRPPDRFAEYRTFDPEGNAIDLSEKKGYKVDNKQTDRIED